VFDDGHRRLLELADQLARGVGVEQVVVGKLLALQLLEAGKDPALSLGGVERRPLVGILAIPGLELLLQVDQEMARIEVAVVAALTLEPGGDRRIVGLGVAEGLDGKTAAETLGHHPITLLERRQHLWIVIGIDHHYDPLVVLGRRPHHRRAADVDHLHHLLEGGTLGCRRLAEGVEVDHHQIDGQDRVLAQLTEVRAAPPVGEDAAMDPRMQGLDPAVQDLGELGHLRDRHHRHPRLLEHLEGAAGREELDPQPVESLGKLRQTSLVVDRE
jgi:hypothetical protein